MFLQNFALDDRDGLDLLGLLRRDVDEYVSPLLTLFDGSLVAFDLVLALSVA